MQALPGQTETIEEPGEQVVLVLDDLQMRRAEVISFLEAWARAAGLSIKGAELSKAQESDVREGVVMLIVSLGALSFNTPEVARKISVLSSSNPKVPVVILSDRNEASEVAAAFRSGIRGYIPSSVNPNLALNALTFILNGGHFFPPSAIGGPSAPGHENGTSGQPSQGSAGNADPSARRQRLNALRDARRAPAPRPSQMSVTSGSRVSLPGSFGGRRKRKARGDTVPSSSRTSRSALPQACQGPVQASC